MRFVELLSRGIYEDLLEIACGERGVRGLDGGERALPAPTALLLAQFSRDDQHVDGAESDDHIDDPRDDRHVAEDGGDEIEAEESHEEPVQTAYDEQDEGDPVECAKFGHEFTSHRRELSIHLALVDIIRANAINIGKINFTGLFLCFPEFLRAS